MESGVNKSKRRKGGPRVLAGRALQGTRRTLDFILEEVALP